MSRHIHCILRQSPEALERVLQVIRIRGFRLLHLEMNQQGERLHLEMTVQGERPVDNLLQQLRKLVGMQVVEGRVAVSGEPAPPAGFPASAPRTPHHRIPPQESQTG